MRFLKILLWVLAEIKLMTHKGLVTLQPEYPFLGRKQLQNKTSASAKLTWYIKEWSSSVPAVNFTWESVPNPARKNFLSQANAWSKTKASGYLRTFNSKVLLKSWVLFQKCLNWNTILYALAVLVFRTSCHLYLRIVNSNIQVLKEHLRCICCGQFYL